jgi:Na+/proline symporter/signal transduction histidine kinase/ActR/RegA family two-component response regulator
MSFGWLIAATALAAVAFLFSIARWADARAARGSPVSGPWVYALSLGVYCSAWTYYGSVGFATTHGFDFLTIYFGPLLLFAVFHPLIARLARLAKAQNITSLADFMASRYGKNQRVAAVVTIIAAVSALPYLALQLKAAARSIELVAGEAGGVDEALLVALSLAATAILFGARGLDAAERQHGLMVAVAAESLLKLAALLVLGLYVTFGLFDGPSDLIARAGSINGALEPFLRPPDGGDWITLTGLAFLGALLLPRMFHVTVVESTSRDDVRRAAWVFPLYLAAITLSVAPVAIAGLALLPRAASDPDMFALLLPLQAGASWATLVALLGGLSSATMMVVVSTVALSIMIANEVVTPALLKRRAARGRDSDDMSRVVLLVRRVAILALVLLAYGYLRFTSANQSLASMGLLSLAAIAQLAPAFLGGLVFRRATARGAVAGMVAGFAVWAYTLLLPSFAAAGLPGSGLLSDGPFGIVALRPQALFGIAFEPLSHGVFWSLFVNTALYVALSLLGTPSSTERLQSDVFIGQTPSPRRPAFRLRRTAVTVGALQDTVARYLGVQRTRAAFQAYARRENVAVDPEAEADIGLLHHCEQLLASAIGAASSRLVLALLLRRSHVSTKAAIRLLDDASAALQYNRDLLQTALDEVGQGTVVVDGALRLVTWNRHFQSLLGLPAPLLQIGAPLRDVFRHLARRGEFGPGPAEALALAALKAFLRTGVVERRTLAKRGRTLEIRTARMPDGGFVATYSDVTEAVRAAGELERANETLERRVRERTEELVRLNAELARAKGEADEANLGKTRFLAAAGHDILQPLNAARLYASALVERGGDGEAARLAANVDTSLDAVEEIIGALLDISRLDAGALRPELAPIPLDDLLGQLEVEFAPLAREKGLRFRRVATTAWARSDRRLLRRLLQNLVSNAVKYTSSGGVLIGVRRRGGTVRVEVRDTGLGIPAEQQKLVFREFQRLEQGTRAARGLGLGLSIVERIGRVLEHPVTLASSPGRGSVFAVDLPAAPAVAPAAAPALPAPGAAQLAGLTVVTIDNEETILDGLAVLLSGWGITVIGATSADAALAAAGRLTVAPDAIVADYHLDEGDGLAAIAEFRARFGESVPAVLVTADRSAEVRAAASVAGVPVLHKPLKPAALRAILARRGSQRPAAE